MPVAAAGGCDGSHYYSSITHGKEKQNAVNAAPVMHVYMSLYLTC